MTPYKSKKSFKTRLVIAISIVNLAVILAITYLTYRWNAQQIQEQTIAQTQQTIEQAGTGHHACMADGRLLYDYVPCRSADDKG